MRLIALASHVWMIVGNRFVLVPVWALTFVHFKLLEAWQEHMDGVKTKVKVDFPE